MNVPDQSALAHSIRVKQFIDQQIQEHGGSISFAQYMYNALYAPGLGYYSNGTAKFGPGGDFITAPELGSLFAQCVATQCAQILEAVANPVILEIGAGSGQLACDLFMALQEHNTPLEQYYILELSAELQQRQQQTIQQCCPEFLPLVTWLDRLPSTPINGVILANEVLDAMPVTRFSFANDELQEYYVTNEHEHFSEILYPASEELEHAFSAANIALYLEDIASEYSSEINLWIPGWIKSLNNCLNQGIILLFDYGFSRAEYYHPQRSTGTLMCHFQHQVHSDPYYYPGLQDITAHVDFTAVAEAAHANNIDVSGYTNLAGFLINCGITSHLRAEQNQARELNILSSPAEMGELFKAMLLAKNMEMSFVGFTQFDKLHGL